VKRFLQLVPVLLLPAIAAASPVWKGDFEPGNLSQWSLSQSVASDRLQVVSDIVREGRYALKATVRQGDDPINASGNRNEVVYLTEEAPGTEYFYKWSTLFPEDYPSEDTWQVFAQWHHDGCCGAPPLVFSVVGEEMRLRAGGDEGKIIWRSPLVRGQWQDFVLRVKWSSDPRQGFVELYKDGTLVVPKTMAATQFSGMKNYLKLGLYRDESIEQVGVVYHDGFTMGTSLEDVMPPPPAPEPTPPAPTPPAPTPPAPAPPTIELPTPPTTPTPGVTPPPSPPSGPQTTMPADPNAPRGGLKPAMGCGASASGGMPAAAAAAMLALVLLTRRRQALARRRARNR